MVDEEGEEAALEEASRLKGGPYKVYRLVKPIDVRWSSYHNCIERMLLLKEAVKDFTKQLAGSTDPNQAEDEKVENWELSEGDWVQLE